MEEEVEGGGGITAFTLQSLQKCPSSRSPSDVNALTMFCSDSRVS